MEFVDLESNGRDQNMHAEAFDGVGFRVICYGVNIGRFALSGLLAS